jgi:hypothetical protein
VGLDCLRLLSCEGHRQHATFRFRFSKIPDPSLRHFLIPLYLRRENAISPIKPSDKDTESYGLIVEETLNNGEREFIRVGMWGEDCRYASQLGPMISNTIVAQGIGETSSEDNKDRTEVERAFDTNLGEYALVHASSDVNFPVSDKDTPIQNEANVAAVDGTKTEEDPHKMNMIMMDHRMIRCSSLPHFTLSEWTTISLV